ncbi:MAG: DUF2442 domain-containing protein [Lentisphaerae bacterium]|nr:DUF2442 domain-containing protein [Lentisphaerota bacterium]
MNPRVKSVQPEADYRLRLVFPNGEERIYDVRPLLGQGGVFRALKDESAFRSVHLWHGTVQWAGGQDICPDTLYEDSIPAREVEPAMVRETAAKYGVKTNRRPNAKAKVHHA